MAIIRWTPLRSMLSLRDEMDKLLDDVYGNVAPSGEAREGEWFPVMDLAETDDDVSASIELPGLKKEDINVSVHNDVLTITGEKKQEKSEKTENRRRIERSYGYFKRSVILPAEVDPEKVTASYSEGILKIVMPKVESKKPKQIPVQISE